MSGPDLDYDKEVLDMAQAAANVRKHRDRLADEVAQLKADLALASAKLQERSDQIDRLQTQLLIAAMRNGQQVSIIEQIQKLTNSYDESVHAAGNGELETRQ